MPVEPAVFLLLANAALEQSLPLYRDVSATHMPKPPLAAQSMDAHSADIDGDGDLDIIIANEHRPNILLINDGDRFSNQSVERLPQRDRDSEDIAAADFDGDGDLDILFVSEDDEENEYYLNDGEGRFEDAVDRFPAAGVTNGLAVADVNGDGAPDVILGNAGQNVLLIADGGGGFHDETEARLPVLSDQTQDVEFGDADGDGDLDILVANEDRNRLLMNNGDGVFADESDQRLAYRDALEETREGDFGDIDGDGDLDIYFANVNFRQTGELFDRLLINNGDGFYKDETSDRLSPAEDHTVDADFVDIEGDGDLDIVTAGLRINGGLAPAPYRVFENTDGAFEEATGKFFPETVVGVGIDVESADFDGDGKPDIFLANRAGPDFLLFRR